MDKWCDSAFSFVMLVIAGHHVRRYITFDAEGLTDTLESSKAMGRSMEANNKIWRAKRMRVPDLRMIIKAKALMAQDQWELTDDEWSIIEADLLPAHHSSYRRIPIAASVNNGRLRAPIHP